MAHKVVNWAYDQKLDNPLKKFVLVTLADGADQHGYLWKHYSTIAEMCNMSRRTVIRHVKQLEAEGYLIKENRDDNGYFFSNVYRLNVGAAIPKDHPLKNYCNETSKTGGDNLTPPSDTLSPGSDTVSLIKEPSINLKEKEALTRNDFFKLIEEEWKSGSFSKIIDLSNDDLYQQIEKCWLYWEGNNKFPEGSYIASFKGWLYTAVEKGFIGKPSKATKEENTSISDNDLHDWQKVALGKGIFTPAEFISWIQPLEWNGNGTLYAPTRFMAQRVEENYMPQLRQAVHSQVQIKVKEL